MGLRRSQQHGGAEIASAQDTISSHIVAAGRISSTSDYVTHCLTIVPRVPGASSWSTTCRPKCSVCSCASANLSSRRYVTDYCRGCQYERVVRRHRDTQRLLTRSWMLTGGAIEPYNAVVDLCR